jgi:hypothetical protein
MGGIGSGRVTSFGQSVEGAILHEVDLAAPRPGPDTIVPRQVRETRGLFLRPDRPLALPPSLPGD